MGTAMESSTSGKRESKSVASANSSHSEKAHLWRKGVSGNPSGRPKVPEHVREAARAKTEEAIKTLSEIMADKSAGASARVSAANSLLDRAWGKAESTSNVNVTREAREMSTAELMALLDKHIQ